jgi:F-type H+-transporting ATPase subunit b
MIFYLLAYDPDLSGLLSFDPDFLVTIGFAWINLAFIIFILSWLLYQPVLNFLQERKSRIENDIESAKSSLQEAEEAKALYMTRLANIDTERVQILDEARKNASANRDEIIADAKKSATNEKERAAREIEMEWAKANDTIKTQIIEVFSYGKPIYRCFDH